MEAQYYHSNCKRDELLKQLTVLDFMLVDLGLFLNTHPDEQEAIAEYNQVVIEADRVRAQFEQHYGSLCSFRSKSPTSSWIWPADPWPWCREGNFNLLEEESH